MRAAHAAGEYRAPALRPRLPPPAPAPWPPGTFLSVSLEAAAWRWGPAASPRAETRRARPAPGKKTGLGLLCREAAEKRVGGAQECGARGVYELPPPRRPVQTEPQDLQGPPPLRQSRVGVGPRSLPPGALIPGPQEHVGVG